MSRLTGISLAFALSFGVLLDTLVVRPILVPAFLLMLQGRARRVTAMSEISRELEHAAR